MLFGLGFMKTIPSPRLGFLSGVFLATHLARTDNLTRTTERQKSSLEPGIVAFYDIRPGN